MCAIELTHIIKKGIFVWQVIIVFKLGINFVTIRHILFLFRLLVKYSYLIFLLIVIFIFFHSFWNLLLFIGIIFLIVAFFSVLLIFFCNDCNFFIGFIWFQELKMPLLFPLCPQKIMFCKIFLVKLEVDSLVVEAWRQYDISIFVVIEGLMNCPPPAVLFE